MQNSQNSDLEKKTFQNKSQKKSNIGVIGLSTMGANLARNFASRGFTTSIFNRTYQKTQELLDLSEKITPNSDPKKEVENLENQGKLVGFKTLEDFVNSLESPRKIILMVKSGAVVDEFLDKLKPLLNPEDIVLDCGNSYWKDTQRRQESLKINEKNWETQNLENEEKFEKGKVKIEKEIQIESSLLETKNNEISATFENKTIHLIGLFNLETLETWLKIIQKSSEFDKIILHLIVGNLENNKEIDKKLSEIWQEFITKFGGKLKSLENKIFLGSIVGANYLQNCETENQQFLSLAHYFHTLLDYRFIDKFDSGDNGPLCNYFYDKYREKYLINLKKYLTEQDEKWLYRTPNHLPNTEDPNFFCYSQDEHHFFGKIDRIEREKLGNLATDIAWIIDQHETKWKEKNTDKADLLPSYFCYIPANDKNLPKNQINKNQTICLINSNLEMTKFTEILQDLNMEFELGLEILTDLTSNYQNLEKNRKQHFHLISCGVSGGEQGALHGPSIMPSGEPEIVNSLLPILTKIAAKDFQNQPCVTNIGLGPSGHFVKMVHNGIEYALMQGIAEIYDVLRYNSYSNEQIRDVFIQSNQGELKNFLLDITIKILETRDSLDNGFLLDKIKDQAGAKGTGSWTVEAALELGVAVPTIAAAVFARTMSARNSYFQYPELITPLRVGKDIYIEQLAKVFELIFRISYLQGLELIIEANKIYKWNTDISEILRIWQGGCIIRSGILKNILQDDKISNLGFQTIDLIASIEKSAYSYRPKPVIHSVFDYILAITSKNLPTNLIQAQRDYFGAHTYERIDKLGTFSGGWEK